MQNALYYYYKARKDYQCFNISRDLFKKVADNQNNPHRFNASLGYIRTIIWDAGSDSDQLKKALTEINQKLNDKTFVEIRNALKIEKERILAVLYDENEFIQAQKNIQNPSKEFIHDMAIFNEQYRLFIKNNPDLINKDELAKHSVFVRYLYYWNYEKPNGTVFFRVATERNMSQSWLWHLWEVQTLRYLSSEDLDDQKVYIDAAFNINQESTKLYYPIFYYTLNSLSGFDTSRVSSIARVAISNNVPDIAYNYLADLVSQKANNLNELLEFMYRKPSFLSHLDTIDYGYTRSVNKTLESMMDEYGWRSKETGQRYYPRFINKKIDTPIDDDILSFVNYGLTLDKLYTNQAVRERFKAKIFTRAFMLGREDILIPLLDELSNTNSLLAQAKTAPSKTARNFLISYTILKDLKNREEDTFGTSLHNSNYNFETNLDDWQMVCNYCYGEDGYYWSKDGENKNNSFADHEKTKVFNKLLTKEDIDKNMKEKKTMEERTLVQVFGEPVLAYIKTNTRDSRIQEALSLLVQKMGRWHGPQNNVWTKKMFEALHYNYPNSKWAKDTPIYW